MNFLHSFPERLDQFIETAYKNQVKMISSKRKTSASVIPAPKLLMTR